MELMTKKYNTKVLKYAKKLKAIDYLGGKCEMCDNNKWYHLEFHHLKDKEYIISDMIKNFRWSKIKNELDKCQLLCKNCHNEFHYKENIKSRRQISKRTYLEYKEKFSCEECNYNKSNSSLSFHHLDPTIKEIEFGHLYEQINSVEELKENIKKELDKCQILCFNCHAEKHTDIDFFNKHKKEILEKKENMIEKKEIDVNLVMNMYNSGFRQVDIRKKLNLAKSTVSCIINRVEKYCKCGEKMSKNSKTCKKCSSKNQRIVERPSYEQLIKEIEESNYSAVGRKYGVSNNAIRKWKKQYEK